MTKKSIAFKATALFFIMLIVNCSTTDAMKAKDAVKMMTDDVTFEKNLFPIMEKSCAPCHFAPNGKKELLDSYDKTKEYIDDIIVRISVPADNKKFMPFKSKKPALTAEEIALFVTWKSSGMAEK